MNRGVLLAVGAYLAWGVFPAYWKALQMVPAAQILCHRMAWSFILLVVLVSVKKDWKPIWQAAVRPRTLLIYTLAACLLTVNWLVYIWEVNAGYIVETSLGYFINPLVSVLLGVLFLRERLRPMQWLAIGLAGLGVLYLATDLESLPWIALVLAFTFALYGLVKKTAPLGSMHGLTLETAIMFLPAVSFLVYADTQGSGAFGHVGTAPMILLILAGAVTTLPLLMFGSAARRINLTTMGILQYIAPTCQLLLGVLVYGESFALSRLVGFSVIWAALLVYSLEGVIVRRREALAATG